MLTLTLPLLLLLLLLLVVVVVVLAVVLLSHLALTSVSLSVYLVNASQTTLCLSVSRPSTHSAATAVVANGKSHVYSALLKSVPLIFFLTIFPKRLIVLK